MKKNLHSAGSTPSVKIVAVSQLFSKGSRGCAGVADLLGVFAVVLILRDGDGSRYGYGSGGLGSDLGLLLLVQALLLVGALDLLLLLGWLEALLVVGNVQRLEWIRHIK